MSLGLIINVKDEADLLIRNIDYHTSAGVDCFLLSERGSAATELEKINDFASQRPDVVIFNQNVAEMALDSPEFIRRRKKLFEKYHATFSSSWVAVIDADEFLLPGSSSVLHSDILKTANLISLPRYNVALPRAGADAFYEKLASPELLLQQEIIVKPMVLSREIMLENPGIPWVMHKVGPKVMTSIKSVSDIAPGFHDLVSDSAVVRGQAQDLLILHLPFSSYDRFARKVTNMKTQLENIGHTWAPGEAWHWRRWVEELTDEESIRVEYEKQFFGDLDLLKLRQDKVIMTAECFFQSTVNQQPALSRV
ncbi:MAG: hypothetical protein WBO34_14370 [Gammaproteobacteria bacterium]